LLLYSSYLPLGVSQLASHLLHQLHANKFFGTIHHRAIYSNQRLGLSSFVEGADRRKQAIGTLASTEPEDIDPTSSQSTAKRGAQHSKNDASKEDTTSIDAAVIQPGKPGLGFHPGMMDGAESGLHGNAPKEENGARKHRHC
jgi:hypothetical protein